MTAVDVLIRSHSACAEVRQTIGGACRLVALMVPDPGVGATEHVGRRCPGELDRKSFAQDRAPWIWDLASCCLFCSANTHSIAQTEFQTMAQAADECITKVAGIDELGPQTVRRENTSLLTQMIADLEARLTEPAG